MNIFEYIDKKRMEYEMLRDENQVQLNTNENRIQKITSQIEHMKEEDENPSQFFRPENTGNYKEEIEKLQGKVNALQAENSILLEKIELCKNELDILDNLELPNMALAEKNMAWEPMRVPEKEALNVSRETFNDEELSEADLLEISNKIMNSIHEPESAAQEEPNIQEKPNAEENQETMDIGRIREKICFCRKFSELDPRRCSLLLDEIINELNS